MAKLLRDGGRGDHEGVRHRLDAAQGAEFAQDFKLMDLHPPSLRISKSYIVD